MGCLFLLTCCLRHCAAMPAFCAAILLMICRDAAAVLRAFVCLRFACAHVLRHYAAMPIIRYARICRLMLRDDDILYAAPLRRAQVASHVSCDVLPPFYAHLCLFVFDDACLLMSCRRATLVYSAYFTLRAAALIDSVRLSAQIRVRYATDGAPIAACAATRLRSAAWLITIVS